MNSTQRRIENKVRNGQSLDRAESRVYSGKAESIGEAWNSIRNEDAALEEKTEFFRLRFWGRIARRANRRRPAENLTNKRRRWAHINACYRAYFYITRRLGLVDERNRAFYRALREILRKIYGRNLAKRAFARHSAAVWGLIESERARIRKNYSQFKNGSYSHLEPRALFLKNRVSYPRNRYIYYLKNNSKEGTFSDGSGDFSANPGRKKHLDGDFGRLTPRATGVAALKGTRIFGNRLPKHVRRRLNTFVKCARFRYDAFRGDHSVSFSRRYVYNAAKNALKMGLSCGQFVNLYEEKLEKWEHIAAACAPGKKWIPSGLVSEIYEEILENV